MTEFASDSAAADLIPVEEGALRGLASVGWTVSVSDLAEFCSGLVGAEQGLGVVRLALYALDGLGWARPDSGDPLHATAWRITEQGRIALERA